jgi:hypothetical protein
MNGPGRVGLGVEVRNDEPGNAVIDLQPSVIDLTRSVIDLDRILCLAYAAVRASDDPHGSESSSRGNSCAFQRGILSLF